MLHRGPAVAVVVDVDLDGAGDLVTCEGRQQTVPARKRGRLRVDLKVNRAALHHRARADERELGKLQREALHVNRRVRA